MEQLGVLNALICSLVLACFVRVILACCEYEFLVTFEVCRLTLPFLFQVFSPSEFSKFGHWEHSKRIIIINLTQFSLFQFHYGRYRSMQPQSEIIVRDTVQMQNSIAKIKLTSKDLTKYFELCFCLNCIQRHAPIKTCIL